MSPGPTHADFLLRPSHRLRRSAPGLRACWLPSLDNGGGAAEFLWAFDAPLCSTWLYFVGHYGAPTFAYPRELYDAATAFRLRPLEEEDAVPAGDLCWGNAVDDGVERRGWFIGHFMPPRAGPATTDLVEVKWGAHRAGETKAIEGVNQTATTMSLLLSGRFRLDFPSHGRSLTLTRPGDYAVWSPGVSHRWHVLEDAVVITVRWPSRPADQSERRPFGRITV